MSTEIITATNERERHKPKLVDSIFTYYNKSGSHVDNASILWRNNRYLITKKDPISNFHKLSRPLSGYDHNED